MTGTMRYLTCPGKGGEWMVVDQTCNARAVASCNDAEGAELMAALMNGDLSALASASPEALTRCRRAMGDLLRVMRPRGRPAVGRDAFPQI